eukprot:CAMPEP_0178989550 /NCGR_PEP_ID=MMETSP0795-20121207/4440_1 /TAXON_ID=88552 /ORGANISM="Amoebophrya sp., Strain Ameob2" /LENGTH=391 /DNA_ID=CAMNT_0020680971 /DNA_START=77 /DNA_END=1249 /DNA_ORIENTATION=-
MYYLNLFASLLFISSVPGTNAAAFSGSLRVTFNVPDDIRCSTTLLRGTGGGLRDHVAYGISVLLGLPTADVEMGRGVACIENREGLTRSGTTTTTNTTRVLSSSDTTSTTVATRLLEKMSSAPGDPVSLIGGAGAGGPHDSSAATREQVEKPTSSDVQSASSNSISMSEDVPTSGPASLRSLDLYSDQIVADFPYTATGLTEGGNFEAAHWLLHRTIRDVTQTRNDLLDAITFSLTSAGNVGFAAVNVEVLGDNDDDDDGSTVVVVVLVVCAILIVGGVIAVFLWRQHYRNSGNNSWWPFGYGGSFDAYGNYTGNDGYWGRDPKAPGGKRWKAPWEWASAENPRYVGNPNSTSNIPRGPRRYGNKPNQLKPLPRQAGGGFTLINENDPNRW